MGLQRVLGLGSYQTAWSWLHKLHRAMVCPGRGLLHGNVEVDETYVGGPEEGLTGRQVEKKAIVVAAIEVYEPKGFGRIRLQQIPDVSGDNLVGFIQQTIMPGSVILQMAGRDMVAWSVMVTLVRKLCCLDQVILLM